MSQPMTHDEVSQMIAAALREHIDSRPHTVPCEPFREHRGTVYWVLGIVSGLAMIAGAYLWAQSDKATDQAALAANTVATMGVKLDFMQGTLTELRTDVRQLVSNQRAGP